MKFNGTFSTNRLYSVFDKYVAVKKSENNEKVNNVTCMEYIQYQYNKLLFNLVFVGETLRHERHHKSIVFPANHFANTNKQNQKTQNKTQLNTINKPKKRNTINTSSP